MRLLRACMPKDEKSKGLNTAKKVPTREVAKILVYCVFGFCLSAMTKSKGAVAEISHHTYLPTFLSFIKLS